METIDKPDELLALHDVTGELFSTLRDWFGVPDEITLDLADVDPPAGELTDPLLIAAMAMRKLQGLRFISRPGVKTSTDVVVSIIQDLDRALLQAPSLWLKREAENADWDAALADLVNTGGEGDDAPESVEDADPQVVRFRQLHASMHAALRAVVEASEGEIRYLV